MRRVILLALLALALPTGALASSNDFTITTEPFSSGRIAPTILASPPLRLGNFDCSRATNSATQVTTFTGGRGHGFHHVQSRVSPCASHIFRRAKPRFSPVVKAPTFATVRPPARLFPIR